MKQVKKKLADSVGREKYLAAAEEVITRIINQLPAKLHGDIRYLFKGKRIRSNLMFSLASHLGCRLSQGVLPAVGVEIVHTISLIHDDVIDKQNIRRGQPTLHSIYGNRTAVLIGDFLLHCLASEVHRSLQYRDRSRIMEALYKKIAELCRGEVLQDIPTGITSPGRREYLQMIRQKTGSLFSYSFMVPTLLFHKEPSSKCIAFSEECGYLFGLAFQLADDIEDIEEDVKVIRKEMKAKIEIPERLFSYPILLWQEMDGDGFKKYVNHPNASQLKKIKQTMTENIFGEIKEYFSRLEIKCKQINHPCAKGTLDFLGKEMSRLFKTADSERGYGPTS